MKQENELETQAVHALQLPKQVASAMEHCLMGNRVVVKRNCIFFGG